ncbi:Hpt domain-containing protein [Halalkalibaculum sp. DA3122]|uniref:Hpt domain-containing protein n=1 Tax=unclassified Halalkalibaculum TaxID=2964617 RepID=UPI0037552552
MAEQKITNLAYLEDLGMGDDELMIEMVELFLTNTPDSIATLRQHCEGNNWKKLAAEAHKLKPNLSYVGLDEARNIIIEIEKCAKNHPEEQQLCSQIDEIDEICQQAYQELEIKLEELKSGL